MTDNAEGLGAPDELVLGTQFRFAGDKAGKVAVRMINSSSLDRGYRWANEHTFRLFEPGDRLIPLPGQDG